MKRLLVPALALGLAMVLANAAWAGLFDEPSHPGDCCKPKCSLCKPKCKPHCPKPCCKPACPKPACDPCHANGLSKLKGCMKGLCHRDRCCSPCGGAAPAAEGDKGSTSLDFHTEPRLVPVPAGTPTTMRSTRQFLSY